MQVSSDTSSLKERSYFHSDVNPWSKVWQFRRFFCILSAFSVLVILCSHVSLGAVAEQPASYLSLRKFFEYCNLPGPCGKKLECEGKTVYVSGNIDWNNIFDKEHYPHLPYEKFRIVDETTTRSLEVWVVSGKSAEIFEKMREHKARARNRVLIKGVAVGIDLPAMGLCERMIRIDLRESGDLSFD